jgi:UDP-glucose 4-epimerase
MRESLPFYLNGVGHIYTSSKIASEMVCHNYSQLYNVPVTVLRLGIPYGPRMREELLIPVFIRKALNGQPLTVSGTGSQYRNFIYVRDIAEAHVMAMKEVAANQTYNLEGARKITVLEVAEGIRAAIGDHVKIEFVPERPGDFAGKEISAEKAFLELGWKPTVTFEEGLRETVQWFRRKWGK